MTLVYRAPKLLDESKRKLDAEAKVGPGTYNPPNDFIKIGTSPKKLNHEKLKQKKNQVEDNKTSKKSCFTSEKKCLENIQKEIGPGKYDIDEPHKKFLSKLKTRQCGSAFNSQIHRFQNPTLERYRQIQRIIREDEEKMMYEILLNKKAEMNGKLFGIGRDRSKISQSIPSIPASDQSYGYRIDPQTKKLIVNQNPHVLLAKKSNITLLNNDVYRSSSSYFPRDLKSIRGPKWHKNQLEKRNHDEEERNRIFHERDTNLIEIKKQEQQNRRNCILIDDNRKWNEKGNPLNHKEERFSNSLEKAEEKKKMLFLNSIKKKFNRYVDSSEIEMIEKIIESKQNSKQKGSQNNSIESKQIQECFLSKQKRFKEEETVKLKSVLKLERMRQRLKQEEEKQVKVEKQKPFVTNAKRFEEKNSFSNTKIGPGSYEINSVQQKNGTLLKRTEERFKQNLKNKNPGPGSYNYNVRLKKRKNQIRKLQQTNNESKNKQQAQNKSEFCLGKTERDLKNLSKPVKKYIIHEDPNKIKLKSPQKYGNNQKNVMKEIKNLVEQEFGGECFDNIDRKGNKNVSNLRKPQIVYHQAEKNEESPGPGYFKIDRDFIKKTHNVTYD